MNQTPKEVGIGSVNFDDLIDKTGNLFYNNKLNRFQLGSIEFEVIEDEQDGYRSMLKKVEIISISAPRNELLASIVIKKDENYDLDGYNLVDELDGHIWLSFGTDNSDNYYPTFYFKFYPKFEKDSLPSDPF